MNSFSAYIYHEKTKSLSHFLNIATVSDIKYKGASMELKHEKRFAVKLFVVVFPAVTTETLITALVQIAKTLTENFMRKKSS